MEREGVGLPIEQFIQALTTQLDRAQAAMAVKAKTAKLPLTFAVKDLSLDLRAHVDVVESVVRIRPAGPGDPDGSTSTLRLALTTITKPMIEENTVQLGAKSDDVSLKEALGDTLTEEDHRRLEWAGVQTVAQLRELKRNAGEHAIERLAPIPVTRLKQALAKASTPRVNRVIPDRLEGRDPSRGTPLLRIQGENLLDEGQPDVRIGGERVAVLDATDREIVVAPLAHQLGGMIEVQTAPGLRTATEFQVEGYATPVEPALVPEAES